MRFPVVIAGAGLCGLSLARELEPGSYYLLESEPEPGGLCRSISHNGYTFDYTGHLMHLKGEALEEVERLLGANLAVIDRRARVHTHGVEFDYPFQIHLHSLPDEARRQCLEGFEAVDGKEIDRTNFGTWCRSVLGEGITRHFMRPYNEKLYRTKLEEMSCEWVQYIPRPKLEEVRAGARGETIEGVGYNAVFRYPVRGGIGELPAALARGLDIRCSTSLVAVDGRERVATVRRADGGEEAIAYDRLVSTIPLPRLIECVREAPEDVLAAVKELPAVGVLCFNMGIDGPTRDAHWMYFPEGKYSFFRVGFYHNIAAASTPPGKSALYVEISYRDRAGLPSDIRDRATRDLITAGIIDRASRVEECVPVWIDAAYAIHTPARTRALAVIKPFLDSIGVVGIGRYGRWAYTAMGEAIMEGKALGKKLRGGA